MSSPTDRSLVVVFTGTTVASVKPVFGDFDAHFRAAIGDAWSGDWATWDARDVTRPLPLVSDFDAIIVTGSSSSVTDRDPWMLRLEGWLRTIVAHGTPLLGVCFGHQILASALGGTVTRNPVGRAIGAVEIARHVEDPLFDGVPERFAINVSHKDHVATLPDRARLIASAPHDRFHAFAVGDRVRGVQFHPEFHNGIIRGYLDERRAILADEGIDADARIAALGDDAAGAMILRNFAGKIARR
jgi:GMP synthase (glutamine-hydrolysing)